MRAVNGFVKKPALGKWICIEFWGPFWALPPHTKLSILWHCRGGDRIVSFRVRRRGGSKPSTSRPGLPEDARRQANSLKLLLLLLLSNYYY